MSALDRNIDIDCDKSGNRMVNKNISRHNKTYKGGNLFCLECPEFTPKTKEELNYYKPKKHRKDDSEKNSTCTDCILTFQCFYALRKHVQTFHVSQSQSNTTLSRKVDPDTILRDHANQQFRK